MFEIATGLRAFNRYKNYKYLVSISSDKKLKTLIISNALEV